MNTISQTFYFGFDGAVPIGSAFEAMWGCFRYWGRPMAQGYLWQDALAPERAYELPLGERSAIRSLGFDSDRPIWGGIDYGGRRIPPANSTTVSELSFGLFEESAWMGEKTAPYTTLSLSQKFYEELKDHERLELFQAHLEFADAASPIFGCVDISRNEDSHAGMVFGSTAIRTLPLYRCVEQARWLTHLHNHENVVRNLYWGNYFSREVLQILDRQFERGFLAAYRDHMSRANEEPSAHVWEFENGSFVSITRDPLDVIPNDPLGMSAAFNIIWLAKALSNANLL